MKRWTKVIQVKIADDQYEALVALASEQQTSLTQILRSTIAKLIKEKSIKPSSNRNR
jgi:hypothetical protein